MQPRKIKGLGWKRDTPDPRDRSYNLEEPIKTDGQLPLKVSLRDQMPPVYDQAQLGSCFPAGTLIRMADGSERAIEDVRLGEWVTTAEGRTGRVRQAMLRTETNGLLKIALYGLSNLCLTDEHPILTECGYVRASDIRVGDWVVLPRYAPADRRSELHTESLISKTERTIKVGVRRMGNIPGKRADVAVTVSTVPDVVKMTPRFGRLVGFFLAEGSTSAGKAIFTFGAHEAETLVAETVDLLRDVGVEAYVKHKVPQNSINVVVYGTAWARFWERVCGTGAGEKTLSPLLTSGSDDFLRAILDGWLAGDGYNRKTRTERVRAIGSTISRQLAMAMYDIAQHLGLTPAFRECRAKSNTWANKRRDFYEVELETGRADNYRARIEDDRVLRRVRAIEREEFAGDVYNLSVEGDESYVANGVGVHNCTANGNAAIFQHRQSRQGESEGKQVPSRLFIYYNERVAEGTDPSQDSGAEVRTGIKVLVSQGAPPETAWPYSDANPGPFAQKPPDGAYQAARRFEAVKYQRITPAPWPAAPFRTALANGLPIVFGFPVPAQFEDSSWDAASTPLALPDQSTQFVGGHCTVCVGYDFSRERFSVPVFEIRNSWGSSWGDAGHFWMPQLWFNDTTLASDFWVIQTVS